MTDGSTEDDDARTIKTYRAEWKGIELEIRFERNWLGMPPSEFHPSHLEVRAVAPFRAPLPITQTGYRSHFLKAEAVDEAGGPVAYVMVALDDAAQTKEWKAREAERQQLSLF